MIPAPCCPHKHSFTFFIVVNLAFTTLCSAYVHWIYPDPDTTDLAYNYIDTVYFTWTSDLTNPTLGAYCMPTDSQTYHNPAVWAGKGTTNDSYRQSFPYDTYNGYFNGTCHMQVYLPGPGPEPGAVGPDFILLYDNTAVPRTWGLSFTSLAGYTPSATGVSNTLTATGVSSKPSTKVVSDPLVVTAVSTPPVVTEVLSTPTADSTGISKSAQAIVGAVCTVGGLGIVAAVLICVKRKRKRTKHTHQEPAVYELPDVERHQRTLYELKGREVPLELGGTPRAEPNYPVDSTEIHSWI